MNYDLDDDITRELMNGKTLEDLKVLSVKTKNHHLLAHLLREEDFYIAYISQLSCIRRKIKVEEGVNALDHFSTNTSFTSPIFSKSPNINTTQNTSPEKIDKSPFYPSQNQGEANFIKNKSFSQEKLSKKKGVDKKKSKVTPYRIYVRENLPEIKKKFPDAKGFENTRKVNAMWKVLDLKTKKIYENRAKQETLDNQKEMEQIPVSNALVKSLFIPNSAKFELAQNMINEVKPCAVKKKPKDSIEKLIKYEIIIDE